LIAGLLLAVAVTWANVAKAQTCSITWTGNVDSWNNPNNWHPRQVPGPTDDVCIPTGEADASTTPSISVNSIQLSQGAYLNFGSGTVSIATSLSAQGGVSVLGTTLSATSVNVSSGGSLNGYGTIEGSLTMSGVILPQAAPITVTGDYTQTSTGEIIEQWGYPGILNVNGNATLSGYLSINFDFKNPPKKGATYTAMTFGGSLTGAFTEASPGTAEYHQHSVVEKF
jgi:hypothetical protein